jgi:hypothetical protein
VLDQNCFYALSWMIKELGKIKDMGLKIEVLQEALKETTSSKGKAALAAAYNILGADYPKTEKLLTQAGDIAQQFFMENNLKHTIL